MQEAQASRPLRATVSLRELVRAATLPGVLYAIALAAAAAYIFAFLIAAAFRLTYPFPLEVTEAIALRNVERVLAGLPLYGPPTLEHVPTPYAPVHFYLAAAIALLTGDSYLPLRVVSLLASIGSLWLVGRIVQRAAGDIWAGLIAAGCLAATYQLGGTVLDLARVDALYVFSVLLGAYGAYAHRSAWVLAASGACLALGGLTKAPIAALPIALVLFAYLAYARRATAVLFILGFAVVLAAGLLLMRWQSGPWATWYVWDLLLMHEPRASLIGRFWDNDLLPRLTLPFVLGPIFLVGCLLRGDRRTPLFFGLLVLGLLSVAWASRSNVGASTNVLLPAHVAVALLLGIGAHEVLVQTAGATVRARAFQSYAIALVLFQFVLLVYNPRLTVPYRSDQQADARLAQRLAELSPSLFAPNLDGYTRAMGSAEQPYYIAVGDLTGEYGGLSTAEGARWQSELRDALQNRRYKYVVLRDEDCCLQDLVMSLGYKPAGPLFPPDDEFWLLKTKHTPETHLFVAP